MKLLIRILELPFLLLSAIGLGIVMMFAFFADLLTRPLTARNFFKYIFREDPAPNQD